MSGVTRVEPTAIIRMVRDNAPVTVAEVQFGFSFPTYEFAEKALRLSADLTGELSEVAGYWTANTPNSPPQGE